MFRTTSPSIPALVYTTHISNLGRILYGSGVFCPDARGLLYREIWSSDIGERRSKVIVNASAGLTIAGCVGLTLSSRSPAHYAVATGYGVERVPNGEIVHLETDISTLTDHMIAVAVADRNPLARDARFVKGVGGFDHVDWEVISSGRFSKSADDPTRLRRAGAEAFVAEWLPLSAVRRIVCWNAATAQTVTGLVHDIETVIPVAVKPSAFFSAGA